MKRMIAITIALAGLALALPETSLADRQGGRHHDNGHRYDHDDRRGRGHGKHGGKHYGKHPGKHHGKPYYRTAHRPPPPRYRHYRPAYRWNPGWPKHRHAHGCRHPVHYAWARPAPPPYPVPYYGASVTVGTDDFFFSIRGR